ncbi:hypothetical protein [Mycolicibacterium gadium]|uniref:Secreted protein n=1 Tax=Mycolicibacterium gadium TaxID=1794 RepID=A0ABT6GYW2_MYCGU|nr:hypothetical protein [Mycolicibacterium gadium]MDG5486775.1 hypothetical protein [Mycolicibacterium gadium]
MKRQTGFAALAAAAPLAGTLVAGAATAHPGASGHLPVETFTVTELTPFTSPSGNIGCYIDPSTVRCDIQERDWSPPPKPASCDENVGWGQGLTLNVGEPATFVCAGDTALTTGNPLAFGDKIVAGSIECSSAPSGITCWDFQYGGEFSLSREAYHLG